MEQEDFMPFMGMRENKRIMKRPYGFLYDIYYTEDFVEPSFYLEDFEVFSSASPEDLIRIHINSGGGRADTLIQIVNNVRTTQARTVGILEGEAHSAAGALFLQCDSFMVGDNAAMLIHEASFGTINSADKVYRHVEFTKRQNEYLFRDMYKYFLTDEEVDDVLGGKDMWLDKDEIYSRLLIKKEMTDKEENDVENYEE